MAACQVRLICLIASQVKKWKASSKWKRRVYSKHHPREMGLWGDGKSRQVEGVPDSAKQPMYFAHQKWRKCIPGREHLPKSSLFPWDRWAGFSSPWAALSASIRSLLSIEGLNQFCACVCGGMKKLYRRYKIHPWSPSGNRLRRIAKLL
jgi:hypothetical protein